jgi:hypothetical protein
MDHSEESRHIAQIFFESTPIQFPLVETSGAKLLSWTSSSDFPGFAYRKQRLPYEEFRAAHWSDLTGWARPEFSIYRRLGFPDRRTGRTSGQTVVYTSDERSDGSFTRPLKSAEPQRISSDNVRRTVGIGRPTFLRAGSEQKDSDSAPAEVGPADPHPPRATRILVVIPLRVSHNRLARHRTCKQPSDRLSADHVTRGAGEDPDEDADKDAGEDVDRPERGPTSAGAESESFRSESSLRQVCAKPSESQTNIFFFFFFFFF